MATKKSTAKSKPKFMKGIVPGEVYFWSAKDFPDTVFEFEAFTGGHSITDADELMAKAVNTCVRSVTNLMVPMENKDGEIVFKPFKKFLPSEHKEIKLNDILDHVVSSALFTQIWNVSKLTAEESGE